MAVQRPAAAVGRDPERGAGRLDDGRRRPVGVAHPGVHHAAGVEPHGVGSRAAPTARPAGRGAAADGPARLASGRGAAAGRRRAASSRRAAPDAARARRSRPAASAAPCGARRPAPRGCPPSGGRTGTPLGHAGSQPRHWMHVSMNRTKSPSAGASRHCTARIASMRPRGDSASSPVTRNVGQCGRHRPHATHDDSSSSSRRRSSGITPPYGSGTHCGRQVGASGSPRQNASRRWASGIAAGSARPARRRISVAATRRSSAIASVVGSPRQRAAVPGREVVVPARRPAPPRQRAAASRGPSPAGAEHSRSQSSSTGPSAVIADVAGVDVAVAHDPVDAGGPAAMALDRRDEADARRLVELVADLGEQASNSPPRERLGGRHRVAGRHLVGRQRVDGGHHPPDGRASPAAASTIARRSHAVAVSSPSTNASGRAGAGTRTPGAPSSSASAIADAGSAVDPPDPDDDVAGGEDPVHADAQQRRRAGAPSGPPPAGRRR